MPCASHRARRARRARPAATGVVGRVPELRARPRGRARDAAPAPGRRHDAEPALPDLVLARFPARARARTGVEPARAARARRGRATCLAQAVEAAGAGRIRRPLRPRSRTGSRASTAPNSRSVSRRSSSTSRAGDCYQVNLTPPARRANEPADPVGLFAALERRNPAPHAALLRFGGAPGAPTVAVVSASPERFLSWRGTRRRDASDQGDGHRPDGAGGEREGPRRERDDRRPRPQRPRSRVRAGIDRRPGAVRARGPSRPPPPRQHRARAAARPAPGSARWCRRRSRRRR